MSTALTILILMVCGYTLALLILDPAPRWHHTAHPSTWGCDHDTWERQGLYNGQWGQLVEHCLDCTRWRVVDLDGNILRTGKTRRGRPA